METREEILGKLYALRAGLSYIATQSDELQDECECYRAYDKMVNGKTFDELPYLESMYSGRYFVEDGVMEDVFQKSNKRREEIYKNTSQLAKVRTQLKVVRQEVEKYKQWVDNNKRSIIRDAKHLKIAYTLLIVAVASILCGMIPILFSGMIQNGTFRAVAMYCFLPLGLIMLLFALKKVFSLRKDIEIARKHLADIEQKLNYKQRDEDALIAQEIELMNTADRLRNEQETLRIAYENKKGEIIGTTYPVYVTLKQDYASIVSESDWENLDLIIYYFETGRATTVKEALFLVDRQKQTEAIVKAIENAGNQIAQTIATATVALMQTIKVACTEICNNIKVVSGHLATISAGISSIAGGVSSLVDATELQNALLSQANRSSADIAADVAYMRLEFEQKRRREGR